MSLITLPNPTKSDRYSPTFVSCYEVVGPFIWATHGENLQIALLEPRVSEPSRDPQTGFYRCLVDVEGTFWAYGNSHAVTCRVPVECESKYWRCADEVLYATVDCSGTTAEYKIWSDAGHAVHDSMVACRQDFKNTPSRAYVFDCFEQEVLFRGLPSEVPGQYKPIVERILTTKTAIAA